MLIVQYLFRHLWCTVGIYTDPLLFNIDVCDLFFEDYSSHFVNFADETTPDEYGPTFNEFMNNLEITTEKMFQWINFNNLKADYSNVICLFFLINLFH